MTPAEREGLRLAQQQEPWPAILAVAIAVLIISLAGIAAAHARWKADYAQLPAEERAWYQRQQTTPETRRRLNATWYKFCCDGADTVRAVFDKQDGRWRYRLDGETQWHDVPEDIVQPDVQTPHGKPVLFVDRTHLNAGPVCFFPGGAGT